MERLKCRFCFKSFINGRALGDHMKSHMLTFSTKRELYELKRNRLVNDELEFDFDDERRSKRTRKLESFDFEFKKRKTSQLAMSSASDTTTEEDLAFCLIMLSRDKWKQQKNTTNQEEEEEEEDYKSSKHKGRFKCETCGKVFTSYQALGGHRASHKKNKSSIKTEQVKTEYGVTEKKIHECPICFRVFSSGQALGGHKRSHGSNIGVNRIVQIDKIEESVKERIIDLNFPATTEEDESETSVLFKYW